MGLVIVVVLESREGRLISISLPVRANPPVLLRE